MPAIPDSYVIACHDPRALRGGPFTMLGALSGRYRGRSREYKMLATDIVTGKDGRSQLDFNPLLEAKSIGQ